MRNAGAYGEAPRVQHLRVDQVRAVPAAQQPKREVALAHERSQHLPDREGQGRRCRGRGGRRRSCIVAGALPLPMRRRGPCVRAAQQVELAEEAAVVLELLLGWGPAPPLLGRTSPAVATPTPPAAKGLRQRREVHRPPAWASPRDVAGKAAGQLWSTASAHSGSALQAPAAPAVGVERSSGEREGWDP